MKTNILSNNHDRRNTRHTVITLLSLSTLLRLIFASILGPGFDEAYYYLFSQNLSGGYFDHPPMVAFTAGLGEWLTGIHHPVTLRLGAVLSFTIALAGFYTLSSELFGHRAGVAAIIIPHATPYFLVGAGAFVIPDNSLTAAWVWFLVFMYWTRENKIQLTQGFIGLGLLAGVAMLSKYHAILIPVSFALSSLLDRKIRSWWTDLRLYFALLIALLVFSPCIFWNSANGWISFAEQLGKGTSGQLRLRFDLLGQALGGQLAYLTPWMAILLWIGSLKMIRKDTELRFLGVFFLLPVVGFTLIGLTRGILPHWTMPGYISAIVLMSGWVAGNKVQSEKSLKPPAYSVKFSRVWLPAMTSVSLFLVILLIIHAKTGLLQLPKKGDPSLDPMGWETSIEWLKKEGYLVTEDVIFVHKWFTGGEVGWADRNQHKIVNLGSKPHMFAWWAPVDEYIGSSGVFITQERYGLDEHAQRELLFNNFSEVTLLYIPEQVAQQSRENMLIWRVENLR